MRRQNPHKAESAALALALRDALALAEEGQKNALARAVNAGKLVVDVRRWLDDNPLILQTFAEWFRTNVKGFKLRTANSYQRIYIHVEKNSSKNYRSISEVLRDLPKRHRTTFPTEEELRERRRKGLLECVTNQIPVEMRGSSPPLATMIELCEPNFADSHDFFATDPPSVRYFLDREPFDGRILEPCSGDGAIVDLLQEYGYEVEASDLRTEGVVGKGGVSLFDLEDAENLVTNPPYTDIINVVSHLVAITRKKCALLLPVSFMGTSSRRPWLAENPPARYYPLPFRPRFGIGGRTAGAMVSKIDHGWFVWDRDHHERYTMVMWE